VTDPDPMPDARREAPRILPLGLTGMLVRFADRLSEPANRAALAFRAALDAAAWDGVLETAPALASVALRFDPERLAHDDLTERLRGLLAERDWTAAPLPAGRRLWRIPTAFGGGAGPQLAEAAELARRSEAAAIDEIAAARLRILTIGFAPGLPYLGELPAHWDIPRQGDLTPQVPAGALAVAVRQLVLFPRATPTGWRQIGRTAFRAFRPGGATPFPLRPGDEVIFDPVCETALADLEAADGDGDGDGGAVAETLT